MSSPLQSTKILLVEDEPIALFVHSHILQEIGYKHDFAKNGRQALEMSLNEYDLILMDIGLPDIDGIQVTYQIRQREKEENKKCTTIIALTAYSLEEVKDNCFAAGMNEVAAKPIEAETLKKLISQFCLPA